MKKILLIEDEKNMSRYLELELQHASFSVTAAYDGETGLQMALADHWDIILLDLMLPKLDGLDLCRRLRSCKQTPVIMLTAKGSVPDRVKGLDCGADDYLPKPFAFEELLARIRVILRRQEEQQSRNENQVFFLQDLCIDMDARLVLKNNKPIGLTKREFDLLAALVKNANRVMDRETLLDLVWGFEAAVDTNVVDVYVRYIRNKIDHSKETSLIQTVRGIGYVVRA
uniref:response regulator transcription factor n=1 Tax=Paenibacillus senegalensis TaxID=1465766 RepID=UPI000474A245|nr:response regulator transcription factor [Paenibacillus senegalensis]